MVIDLERKESFLVLFKLITGVLVAFVISCCVFFIKPYNIDPRFGLCVGGLFATIGNKYIIEGMVPSTNEVTMLDDIHNVTLVFIFLIITISVISLHLYEKGSTKSLKLSRLIDRISFIYRCHFIFIITDRHHHESYLLIPSSQLFMML